MIKAQHRFRQLTVLAFLSSTLLAACGGDDDPSPTSAAPGGSDRAPTITGSPATTILEGNAYSFTPTASDADGDTLTFSVTNLPAWAGFNSSTGNVSGTPTASQIGTYSNIRISVSDRTANANLAPFDVQVVATATGSALLTWTPPTQNTDGTPLTDLAGYKIYWGVSQGTYPKSAIIDNPGITSYVVEQLTPATWYFALTAVNSAGAESAFSNGATKAVR